jgi:Protein of unknown function (DUF2569)
METQPRPIGGWLILVTLGLALTPLRLGVSIVTEGIPFFTGETWKALTTPGREAYHPLRAPLLIFELLGNAAFCIWAVVLFWPLFKRKRAFPRLIIISLVANFTFVLVDLLVASRIPSVGTIGPETMRELIGSGVTCVIWVPYFIMSKRVAGTFVL